jgi:hypothetical protein
VRQELVRTEILVADTKADQATARAESLGARRLAHPALILLVIAGAQT